MADYYVWSGATGAANGTSWTDAYTTISAAAAVDAAGDVIRVAHDHLENNTSNVVWGWAGSTTNPPKVICVNRTTGAPANTAVVRTTGNFYISSDPVSGMHMRGIIMEPGVSSNSFGPQAFWVSGFGGRRSFYRDLTVKSEGSNTDTAGAAIDLQNNWGRVRFENLWVKINTTNANHLKFTNGTNFVEWVGGGVLAGTVGSKLIGGFSAYSNFALSDLDLSAAPAPLILFNVGGNDNINCTIRKSKLPANWSGSVVNSTPGANSRISMYNCDSGNTNYRMWIEDNAGVIRTETTRVRTGGATDGVTPISWWMVSNANVQESLTPLVSDPIEIWNTDTGVSKTLTIEVLHDSTTALTDAEIWVEVSYPNDASSPLGAVVRDSRASVITTAANQDASSVAWTTTDMSNPNKQKLVVTFTPLKAGWITARVFLAKTSKTVYVCPKPELT